MSQSKRSISSVLSTLGWILTIFVIVSLLLTIAALILSTLLLLIGRLLAQWFEVRVFEAALLALGVVALAVFVFTRRVTTMGLAEPDEDWDDDWDEDDEDDWDEEEDEEDQVIVPPRSRNDPCPCGSGKKYKYCHGRNA